MAARRNTGGAWHGCARFWRPMTCRVADQVLLLAQPRVLGHVFNPVSAFGCAMTQWDLRVW